MARLPAERIPFFRLSPAQAGQARCFGARLAKGDRLDAAFSHPRYDALESRIDAAGIPAPTLGELIESISSGATPSRDNAELYADSGVRFMRILNVVDGEIAENGMKYITDAVHNGELKRSQLAADDVLMTITGRVGSAAVVRDERLPANINQHIVRMRVNKNAVRPEFLSEWLNSASGLALSNRSVSGATRIALDYKAILAMRIPLPPLDEQRRLADAVAAARAERKAKLAEADALLSGLDDFVLSALGIALPETDKRRVFAVRPTDLVGRFDVRYHAYIESLRSSFPIHSLGDLVAIEPAYGSSQRALPRTSESQPRYIRITDFGDDGIGPGHEFMTLDAPERKHELELHDLLFARTGSVGKTYIHEDASAPAVFAGYCIRFRFDAAKVLPEFVYWWTKTSAYTRWINAIQRPSVQANINAEEFKRCPIPLPSLEEQREVVASIRAARERARALREQGEQAMRQARAAFEKGLLG